MRIFHILIIIVVGIFLFSNDVESQLSIDTDIAILKAQSDEGNSDAKFYLGTLYYIGRGMTQDFGKAIKLFEQASDGGNVSATFNLGIIYAKGRGVDVDEKKAFDYYKKSAFGGLPQAQYNYALWLREGRVGEANPIEAVEWFRASANKNFDRSLIELAKGYETGVAGRRDYREAVKLYRRARVNDDSRDNSPYLQATFHLGRLYLKGLGVSQDTKKGIKFIREAAEGRVNTALVEMGRIYEEGRYLNKDLNSALIYFTQSRDNGFLDSEDDITRVKKKLGY